MATSVCDSGHRQAGVALLGWIKGQGTTADAPGPDKVPEGKEG